MGRAKPSLNLAGRPLVSYPIAAARAAGLEPWVVAKEDSELPALDCRVLFEPRQPSHPLHGIVTALRAAGSAPVVAIAADMPFVGDELLAWLAAQPATAAVEAGGRLQPLLARYDSGSLEPLERGLSAGESVAGTLRGLQPRLLDERELRRFGDPEVLSFNVNTPEDLIQAEEILRARASA